jgi:hypothetical protein
MKISHCTRYSPVADEVDMVCLVGSSREFFDGDVGAETLIESDAFATEFGKLRFMSLIFPRREIHIFIQNRFSILRVFRDKFHTACSLFFLFRALIKK